MVCVIFEEKDGYTLITYNEDKTEFYVNGGRARSIETYTYEDADIVASPYTTWSYFDTSDMVFDAAGLGVSIVIGVVSGYFNAGVYLPSAAGYIASQIGSTVFRNFNYGVNQYQ